MIETPLVILLLLDSRDFEANLRLTELCMSVSLLGANMRLATSLSHIVTSARCYKQGARILILAGLDAPDCDARQVTTALNFYPKQRVIALVDQNQQIDSAVAAKVDLVLPTLIDSDVFQEAVQSLIFNCSEILGAVVNNI